MHLIDTLRPHCEHLSGWAALTAALATPHAAEAIIHACVALIEEIEADQGLERWRIARHGLLCPAPYDAWPATYQFTHLSLARPLIDHLSHNTAYIQSDDEDLRPYPSARLCFAQQLRLRLTPDAQELHSLAQLSSLPLRTLAIIYPGDPALAARCTTQGAEALQLSSLTHLRLALGDMSERSLEPCIAPLLARFGAHLEQLSLSFVKLAPRSVPERLSARLPSLELYTQHHEPGALGALLSCGISDHTRALTISDFEINDGPSINLPYHSPHPPEDWLQLIAQRPQAQAALEALELVGERGATINAQALLSIASAGALHTLKLRRMIATTEATQALASPSISSKLNTLSLYDCALHDAQLKPLLAATWPKLRKLDLDDNHLSARGLDALAQHPTLAHIELSADQNTAGPQEQAEWFTLTDAARVGELRSILSQKPSDQQWQALLALLETWEDEQHLAQLIPYINGQLAAWPIEQRFLTSKLASQLNQGIHTPAHQLVSHLDSHLVETTCAPALLAQLATTLPTLRGLDLNSEDHHRASLQEIIDSDLPERLVWLSLCPHDQEQARVLAPLLAKALPALEQLHLYGDAEALLRTLVHGPHISKLKTLSFSADGSLPLLTRVLEGATGLETLKLTQTALHAPALRAALAALKLRSLTLNDCALDEQTLEEISAGWATLESLTLDESRFGPALANALHSSGAKLQALYLLNAQPPLPPLARLLSGELATSLHQLSISAAAHQPPLSFLEGLGEPVGLRSFMLWGVSWSDELLSLFGRWEGLARLGTLGLDLTNHSFSQASLERFLATPALLTLPNLSLSVAPQHRKDRRRLQKLRAAALGR